MKRRDFVAGATGAGAALSLFPAGLYGLEREKGPGGLERRALGKTGEKLSIIGFGGIVVMNATTEQAAERVRAAVEAGVNYFDVAPSYGNAEDMLGPALEPHRKGVFLACKTQGRTKEAATKELESSLRKMRTDHFDLYQHHAVTTEEGRRDDPRPRRGDGGLRGGEEGGQGALPAASRPTRSRRRPRSWTATPSTRSSSRSTTRPGTPAASGPRCSRRRRRRGWASSASRRWRRGPGRKGRRSATPSAGTSPSTRPRTRRWACASRCRTR